MARGRRNRVGPRLVSLFDGPRPAFAKDGTNPFTRKIVEIPHRGGHLARLFDGFDPAEDHFEMLAVAGGYRIESPCCSRNIDADGGIIDVALLQYDLEQSAWQLYRKDHRNGTWEFHSTCLRLPEVLEG